MKEIKGVGFTLPSNDDDFIKLDSLSSLSESDIVIFDPSFRTTEYSTYTGSFDDGTYNGKSCYNHDSSAQIAEHCLHWHNEIKSYLNTGKTLFVVLSEKKSFYIQTGKKEYSGTGRNRQVTNIVSNFDNFKFLPNFDGLKYNVAHGKKILSSDFLFHNFLKSFNEFITYETYLNIDAEFRNGFTTKNKDKILGGVISAFGGQIVFLPKIDLDTSEFTEYNEKEEALWTEEAIIIGKRFIQSIIEIDSTLRKKSNKTPKPDWTNHKLYSLKKSEKIKESIENNREKITNLNTEIQELNEELIESEKLNDLLFETGKPLEEAVIYALKILGFKAENFDDGVLELDQVITSPEGWRFIGECEGKDNKAIDITKFRQLSDALNEDFERDEVNEKAYGLLFGNPFRLTAPSKRKSPFTDKCKSGAEREKIGLVETIDLYKVSKYLLENKNEKFKKECRKAIFEKLGEVIKFPTIKEKK
ncbi:hypothetical protein [Winogradskyella damuponensis]|uniref:Uncharacterized protein n=1 Tax=Winogradskyella damuponensis TaxID=943939 RepID=A0ABP8CQY5_9FLAO